MGCFPEGKRVLKTLNQKDSIEKEMFQIKKLWRGEPKCFGSGYCISIKNTGSFFLSFLNILKKIISAFLNLFYFPFSDEILSCGN